MESKFNIAPDLIEKLKQHFVSDPNVMTRGTREDADKAFSFAARQALVERLEKVGLVDKHSGVIKHYRESFYALKLDKRFAKTGDYEAAKNKMRQLVTPLPNPAKYVEEHPKSKYTNKHADLLYTHQLLDNKSHIFVFTSSTQHTIHWRLQLYTQRIG